MLEKAAYSLKVRFKSFFRNQFVIRLEKEKKEEKGKGEEKEKGKEEKEKEKGKRKEKGKEKVGKGPKGEQYVSITHLESVRRIWYVPADRLEALGRLMAELAEVQDTLVPAPEVREDQLYAVRYTEDGELYRVRVLVTSEDGVEVEYVDYGNQETVEVGQLLQLPEQLATPPPFARLLLLKGAEHSLDCVELKERLEAHLAEAEIRVQVAEDAAEGTLVVDGKPLNLLQWLRPPASAPFNLFRHLGSVRVDCYVSNVEPAAGEVWILEQGMLEHLERLMADLQTKAKGLGKLRRPEKGKLACTRFSQDGDYYRSVY